MKNNVNHMQHCSFMSGKTALTAMVFAAAMAIAPLSANAMYTISTQKICDANSQDCAGSPETDIFKVTITRNNGGSDTQFDIDWLVPAGTVGDSALPVDLAASSTWTIQSFGDNSLQIGVQISNDTDLSGYPGTNSAILSFGFGIQPDSTVGLSTSGSTFDTVETQTGQQQFPGGFKDVDICVYSANGCSGGNVNNGLQAGGSDTVALTLTPGSVYGDTVELLFFPLKFQGTWGSFEPGGTPGDGGGGGGGPGGGVPVPAPLALLGLGAVLLRWMARREA